MYETKKKTYEKKLLRGGLIKGTVLILAVAIVGSLGFPNVLLGAPTREILIGQIHPLSGNLAVLGQGMRNAFMLAINEINDAGGIKSLGGAKLKVLDADSEGKADLAIREVERLYREGAVVITGCLQSAVTIVATQAAEKLRVPFVVTVSGAEVITERGFKYTFRIQPTGKHYATATCQYISDIAKEKGVETKTIAHLHDDTETGVSVGNYVASYAPQYGLKVITRVTFSPKAADFSTEVGKVKAAGADIILHTGYFSDSVLIYRTIKDLRVKHKAIVGLANAGYSHPDFLKELREMTEYVMDINYQANFNSPLTQKAYSRYKALYGREMSPTDLYAYQTPFVVADAIERAKSVDREAVREALTKTHITNHLLPQGPIVFAPNGQNEKPGVAMMQILGGEIKVVWPKPYANGKVVYPVPTM